MPLRARLSLLLAMMFVAALLLGTIALQIFSTEQMTEESGPAARSTRAVAEALNASLQASGNPRQTLDAFAQSLGSSESIQFRPLNASSTHEAPVEVRTPMGRVPRWFIDLHTIPEVGVAFPVFVEGKRAGNVVFSPDISSEIYEKWIAFLAIIVASTVLTLLTAVIAYFTVGTALKPLEDLADGLTRMRNGDFSRAIPVAGPPEIRRSCEQANDLARRLDALSADNRGLLHRIVSLQDDERRDIARELHDELGPLLFGIRAGVIALQESVPEARVSDAAESVLQSVEALQQANRRILDHLRPLYIQELGLVRSIETLLKNAPTSGASLTSRIDPRVNELEGTLSQTVYRVIQEGVTNALRHAGASSIHVRALLDDHAVTIEVSDDGAGFVEVKFGRGLTGMHERVRALSGTFEVLREAGKSVVRCTLPVVEPAAQAGPSNARTEARAGS